MTTDVDRSGIPARRLLMTPHGGPEELFALHPVRGDGLSARAAMGTGRWLDGPSGVPMAGGVGVLMDDVLGQAILLARPDGHWSVTTELSLDFLHRLPEDGSPIRAEADRLAGDPGGGISRGTAVDDAGRLLVVGTSWARLVPQVPETVLDPPAVPRIDARPDSLAGLLGVRDGTAAGELVVPAGPSVGNPAGVLHGGVLACAAELAAVLAAGPPTGLHTSSLRVRYLRPAVGDVTFRTTVRHRGRSLVEVDVVAHGAAGPEKPCARATVVRRSPVA